MRKRDRIRKLLGRIIHRVTGQPSDQQTSAMPATAATPRPAPKPTPAPKAEPKPAPAPKAEPKPAPAPKPEPKPAPKIEPKPAPTPIPTPAPTEGAPGKVLIVDQEECIACGTCVENAEDSFVMPDDGKAVVISQEGPADLIEDAIDACPVTCIHWTDDPSQYPQENDAEGNPIG